MDYQTYRPMTIPSKTRRTFTRNTFAEHNYNYAHSSKTKYPPRKKNNQIRSRYWDNPMATTNSVKFQTNSHPPQDRSENYHSSNKIKITNIHTLIQTIYHPMKMIITNQIFLHHILKIIAHKDHDNLNHLEI